MREREKRWRRVGKGRQRGRKRGRKEKSVTLFNTNVIFPWRRFVERSFTLTASPSFSYSFSSIFPSFLLNSFSLSHYRYLPDSRSPFSLATVPLPLPFILVFLSLCLLPFPIQKPFDVRDLRFYRKPLSEVKKYKLMEENLLMGKSESFRWIRTPFATTRSRFFVNFHGVHNSHRKTFKSRHVNRFYFFLLSFKNFIWRKKNEEKFVMVF